MRRTGLERVRGTRGRASAAAAALVLAVACQAPPHGRVEAGVRGVSVSGDRAGFRRDDRRQPGPRLRSVEARGELAAKGLPLAFLAGAAWRVEANALGDPHERSRAELSKDGAWRAWAERRRDLHSTDTDDPLATLDITRVSHAAGLDLSPGGEEGGEGLHLGVHWRRSERDAVRVSGWRLLFSPLEPLVGREALREDEYGLAAGWDGDGWELHGALTYHSGRERRADSLSVPSPYLPAPAALALPPPPGFIDPGLFPTDQTQDAAMTATVRSPSAHVELTRELADRSLELYGEFETHDQRRVGSLRQDTLGPTQDPGVVLDFRARGGSVENHRHTAGRAGVLWRALPELDLSLEVGREEEKGEGISSVAESFVNPGGGSFHQVVDLTHAEMTVLDLLAVEGVLAPAEFLDLRLRGESGRDHYLVRKTAFGSVIWRTDTTYPHRLYEADLDLKPTPGLHLESLARYGRTTALTVFAWEGPRFERLLRQRARWRILDTLTLSAGWEAEDSVDRVNDTDLRRVSRNLSAEFVPAAGWQALLSAGSERWDWSTVSRIPVDFRMVPVRFAYDDDLESVLGLIRREGEALDLGLQASFLRGRGDSGIRAVDLRARAGWAPGVEPDLRPFLELSWNGFRSDLEAGDGYRALVFFAGLELVF